MGKRCQVCDGPVVNGRCKYCGMPYRNDLELYHLNEDRSEHYRHASAKVRKAMAESEIPLPDRNKTANKSSKTSTVKKTVPKAKTEKVQTSVKKASAGQNVGTRTYTTNRNPVQKRKEKKKSKKGLVAIVVIVLIALAGGAAFAYKMQADKKELADFSQKVAAFQSEKLDGRDFGSHQSYFTDFSIITLSAL